MERTARIQTIEELREACAEFGVEMSPEDEQAFMAAKAELRELSEGELDASVGGSSFFGPGSPYINLFDTCDQWDGRDFDNRMLIAPFLLHRSTLHCYSVPWQTAT